MCSFVLFESRKTHVSFAFSLVDPMPSLFSYMITYTRPLNVNEFGDLIHSLGHLFHPYGADFISIGQKFKSLHHLGADYISQELSQHWILVVLHDPNFHPTTVLDPGEKIYLLPKKNIPLDISIQFGATSTTLHNFFSFHLLS